MKRNLTLFVVIFLALAITLSLAGCEIIGGLVPEDDLTDNSQENENGNEEPEIEYSEGLRYELSRDGKSYIVKGIGECVDEDVKIPAEYCGLPVKKIGESAFCNLTKLKSVVISEGIESIDSSAFYKCVNLTSVELPSTVKTISSKAFLGCRGLLSLDLKDVERIGENAFSYCLNVTSVTLADGLISIGNYAFAECKKLAEINIPDSVSKIGDYAFSACASIESVTGCKGVTSIGTYAFCDCENLADIVLGEGISYVGEYAFLRCNKLGYNEYEGGLYLGNEDDPYLVMVDLVSDDITEIRINVSVKIIASSVFYSCNELGYVYYDGIDTEWNAVIKSSYNDILNSAEKIYKTEGEGASIGLSFLRTFDTTYYQVIGIGVCKDTDIVIPDKYNGLEVRGIIKDAFDGCENITSITLSENIRKIEQKAFSGCDNLAFNEYENGIYLGTKNNPYFALIKIVAFDGTSFEMIDSTAAIAGDAFKGWNKLENISLGESLKRIEESLFVFTSIKSLVIPDSVEEIAHSAFYGCDMLETLVIGNGVKELDPDMFRNGPALKKITFGNGLKIIGPQMFYASVSLVEISIGSGVKEIAASAFADCINLEKVVFSEGLEIIGNEAFSGCTALREAALPEGVKSIGREAFSGCESLLSVNLPDSVEALGIGAFRFCSAVETLNFGNGISEISNYAFEGCESLKSIIIPASVKTIKSEAFMHCIAIESITFLGSDVNINDFAFYSCEALKEVFYVGTEEEWASLEVGYYNDALSIATVYFNTDPNA